MVERVSTATPDRRNWHIDKTLSVSHLIATVSIAGSIIVWGMKMDNRVSNLETAQAFMQRDNQNLEKSVEKLAMLMREDLREINAKLDRIAEQKK